AVDGIRHPIRGAAASRVLDEVLVVEPLARHRPEVRAGPALRRVAFLVRPSRYRIRRVWNATIVFLSQPNPVERHASGSRHQEKAQSARKFAAAALELM